MLKISLFNEELQRGTFNYNSKNINLISNRYNFNIKNIQDTTNRGSAALQDINSQISYDDSALYIDSNKNVGIGTTSPLYKLDVNGTARVTGQFDIYGGTRYTHFNFGSNNDVYIRSGESAGKVILQDGGGKVGIGETSPSYELHVNGQIYASNGGLLSSDDRIKHNEQPLLNALSILSKLKPKHYIKTGNKLYDASHNFQLDASGNPLDAMGNRLRYIEDYTIENGIIAQDIQNIPELTFFVFGDETNDNPLSIDYNSIHCTHIAATQEIDKIQQAEKAKLAAAETKLAAAETEIATLKTQLATVLTRLDALEHP